MSEPEKIISRDCRPQEVIFKQGASDRHLYLILSGVVEIYKTIDGTRQSISLPGRGEIFGEMGLLTRQLVQRLKETEAMWQESRRRVNHLEREFIASRRPLPIKGQHPRS